MNIDQSLDEIVKRKKSVGKGGLSRASGAPRKAPRSAAPGTRAPRQKTLHIIRKSPSTGFAQRGALAQRGGVRKISTGGRVAGAVAHRNVGHVAQGRGVRTNSLNRPISAAQRTADSGVWQHDKFMGAPRTSVLRKKVVTPLIHGDLRSTIKTAKKVQTLKESQQEDLRASINASRVQQRIGKPAAPPADPILVVNNLAESVSARDIQDLFTAEGALKKVTLRNGSATVVFVNIEEANAAYTKYNGVTLDGKPMRILKPKANPLAAALAAVQSQ